MPSPSEIERLRQAQIALRRLVERELAGMFGSLNLNNPERAAVMLRDYIPALVARYGEAAASIAADWYDETRAAEGVAGAFRAVLMASPYLDAAEPLARRAAGALFTPRPSDALTTLQSSVGKYVLAASRETIATSTARDPWASGWKRVTRSGSCGFCRMLAGRGGVYKESTAHFASHGDCNCAAVPSWDERAPEVDVELYRASQRTTGMSPEQKARHNALIREAIPNYT